MRRSVQSNYRTLDRRLYFQGNVNVADQLRSAYIAVMATVCVALCACVPLAGREQRAANSSFGCMQRVRDDKLPVGINDEMKHCLAAALIARYCSRTEAWMASVGKEIEDVFGPGDAEWADIQADRSGVTCARAASSDEDLRQCCESLQRGGRPVPLDAVGHPPTQ